MKTLAFVVIAACLSPMVARAQVFGQWTGAEPLPMNGRMFGGYLQSSENVASLMTQLRLSFYPGVDFGFQGGLARQDFGTEDRTTLRLGTDFKCAVLGASTASPFTLSLGGALGVETGDDFTVLAVGPTAAISRAFSAGQTSKITPYVGAGLMFTNIDVGSDDSSDLTFPIQAGAVFGVNTQLNITGELQFRISDSFYDDVGFSLGVNLPF